jgi:4-hydroxy-tetrahydrodipicolinate synthase
MKKGCYTAIVTPFSDQAAAVDYKALEKLVAFQISNGITGILAAGTTGESPTLAWEEHHKVTETIAALTRGKCLCIAGTGSNNTRESIAATKHAVGAGAEAVLLVDPYYNGPSSLEIRNEYIAPVASRFPDTTIIPYVIPGRTGAQIFPEDLALLFKDYPNVNTVKEATANIDNMKRTRECCGPDYTILSGDDGMTFQMMTDPQVEAAGVISVITNITPGAIAEMVGHLNAGNQTEALKLKAALDPLFSLVTVTTEEETPYGSVACRARNPLGIKTLMAILGMPVGTCRQPLGKMSRNGIQKVLDAAKKVQQNNPEILQPLADFFSLDIDERLNNPAYLADLFYPAYR